MSTIQLSIVIPTYNSRATIGAALTALQEFFAAHAAIEGGGGDPYR